MLFHGVPAEKPDSRMPDAADADGSNRSLARSGTVSSGSLKRSPGFNPSVRSPGRFDEARTVSPAPAARIEIIAARDSSREGRSETSDSVAHHAAGSGTRVDGVVLPFAGASGGEYHRSCAVPE